VLKDTEEMQKIFDRRSVKLHRDRAVKNLDSYDFLFCEVARMLIEKLDDINRSFSLGLDLGCHTGQIEKLFMDSKKIETIIKCDISEKMVRKTNGLRFTADEEFLPVGSNLFDIVISCLSLHWVNDLPGALIQIHRALKEDGLFLGSLLGGETLKELRQSLITAESQILDGISPRVSPFLNIQDGGSLLQRAGFALPVVDTDLLTVSYESPLKLMHDLRGMGEQMATYTRQKSFTRRDILYRAAEIYQSDYGDADGRVPASFEVITLTAWVPSNNQPKPLIRGSGKINLADILTEK
jgi:SAM-dependent methyltransferase